MPASGPAHDREGSEDRAASCRSSLDVLGGCGAPTRLQSPDGEPDELRGPADPPDPEATVDPANPSDPAYPVAAAEPRCAKGS